MGGWLGQGSRQLGGGPMEHPRALMLDAAPSADMCFPPCAALCCAAVQGSNTANAPKPTGAGVSITNLPALEVYVIPYGEPTCLLPQSRIKLHARIYKLLSCL